MKYDFTSILDRRDKDAIAVDIPYGAEGFDLTRPKEGFDLIPMWVADMNFPALHTITDAIIERAGHPAFGYFLPRDEYYEEITEWHRKRNNAKGLTREHIGYENGVLGGLISALNVFCSKGDHVLLESPTYIGFTGVIENNGYDIVLSPLVRDEKNIWRMDLTDMEEKIRKYHIHATVFCSPHNPCGRVWEKWEIEQAMELFRKYDVYVISDEIWSDIILYGNRHIPTQSVSDDARNRTVALYAPSKTFNLAGLVGSYHIIYNPWIRDRVNKESSLANYNSMNVLSMYALIGAYKTEGYEWVDELCSVLSVNVDTAMEYLDRYADEISVSRPQGTYMLLLDCEMWCRKHRKTMDDLIKAGQEVGVMWQDGRPFHYEYGIRMNLALPEARVKEAFDRLIKYVL